MNERVSFAKFLKSRQIFLEIGKISLLRMGVSKAGIRMRSGMRMRTHRMREILLNADKDANASDRI